MNGEAVKLIVQLVPEAAEFISKFHKPKDTEIQTVLLALLLKSNREGFDKIEARLDMTARKLEYQQSLMEQLIAKPR